MGLRYGGGGRDDEHDSGQRMQADRERHDSDSPRARNIASAKWAFCRRPPSVHHRLEEPGSSPPRMGSAGSAPFLEVITSFVILDITKLSGDYGLRIDGSCQVGLTRIGIFSPRREAGTMEERGRPRTP